MQEAVDAGVLMEAHWAEVQRNQWLAAEPREELRELQEEGVPRQAEQQRAAGTAASVRVRVRQCRVLGAERHGGWSEPAGAAQP